MAKALINPKYFVGEEIGINPTIPGHLLPLSISDIVNYNQFFRNIPLGSAALDLLQKNALVVISTPLDIAEQEVFLDSIWELANPKDDFIAYYQIMTIKKPFGN